MYTPHKQPLPFNHYHIISACVHFNIIYIAPIQIWPRFSTTHQSYILNIVSRPVATALAGLRATSFIIMRFGRDRGLFIWRDLPSLECEGGERGQGPRGPPVYRRRLPAGAWGDRGEPPGAGPACLIVRACRKTAIVLPFRGISPSPRFGVLTAHRTSPNPLPWW